MKCWTSWHSPLFIHLICSAIRVSVTDCRQLRSLCSFFITSLVTVVSCRQVCLTNCTEIYIHTLFSPYFRSTAISSQPVHTIRSLVDSTSLLSTLHSDNRHMQCCVFVLLQGLLVDSDPVQCQREDTDRSAVTRKQCHNSATPYCSVYLWVTVVLDIFPINWPLQCVTII